VDRGVGALRGAELAGGGPGTRANLARLAELLIAEAVKHYGYT
jgi:hypothetical protein